MSVVTYANVDTPVFEIDFIRYLFTNGAQGTFWGPLPYYSDAAGTVEADWGDPVGFIPDASGNEQDWTQVTSTARPILRDSPPRLEFDGTDDQVTTTLPAISGGTIVLAGTNGIWIDSLDFAGGAFSVGPDTYTGGPDGLMSILGDILARGCFVIDRALTPEEIAQVKGYYKARGSAGLFVLPPAGLGWAPPIRVLETGVRSYVTDFTPEDYIVPSEVTYYLSPDGDDENDGLTPIAPKKSIAALIDALNQTPPSGATFYLAPGMYLNTDSMDGRSLDFDLNLICSEGRAILAMTQEVTWTKEAGREYCWRTSTTETNSRGVVDLSVTDDNGLFVRPHWRSSVALVDATPGTSIPQSSSIVVHLHDSREPDEDVIVFSNSHAIWLQLTAQNTYMKNIEFWGGSEPVRLQYTIGSGATNVFDSCRYLYSSGNLNGFTAQAADVVINNNCIAAYNTQDGFSYNTSARGIEIGCIGVWNGQGGGAADNGTTAHTNARTVRINGDYTYNGDRNVHDVNNTRNWLVGCRAGFAQNDSEDPYANANFLAGSEGTTAPVQTWMVGCESLGGSVTDLGAFGNSVVIIESCVGMNNAVEGDNGQIIELIP